MVSHRSETSEMVVSSFFGLLYNIIEPREFIGKVQDLDDKLFDLI